MQSQDRHSQAQAPEARYDSETQRAVIALAARLQEDHYRTLSAADMERAAVEAGIDVVYVRQAIAQITAEEAENTANRERLNSMCARPRLIPVPGISVAMVTSAAVAAGLCGAFRAGFESATNLAYGGFVAAAVAGIGVRKPGMAFVVGACVMAAEFAGAFAMQRDWIHIEPREVLGCTLLAGSIASVSCVVRRLAFVHRKSRNTAPRG